MKHATKQLGFTIIEMMLAAIILLALGATITGSMNSFEDITSTGKVLTQLQLEGAKALKVILTDLKQSGFENNYPYTFLDGNATGAFAGHAHLPVQQSAQPGDPDFGSIREIVYLLPQDADSDQIPDIDPGTGNLIWDPQDFSFIVTTGPNSVNYLEKRANNVLVQSIAKFVERITFETRNDIGGAEPIADDSIRVRIWFRAPDHDGRIYRHQVETIVHLPNKAMP